MIGNSYQRRNKYGQYGEGELPHAFLWQNGKLTDLGTLPGGKTSTAVALNDHNQIAGWATTKSGQRHAVLWTLKTGG